MERMGADTVRQIQDYFTEGLTDAGESYRAAGGTKNTTDDGGVRYEIRKVNGTSVVWIEDNILKGKKGQPEHQIVASYIASHIGELYTIIESGQKVYVGKELPQEYTQSKYTQAVLQNAPGIARAKNRAAANLGEMIEIATNRRWEKAKHTHNKDAKYGIYKYDTKFGFPIKNSKGEEIGANVYSAELVIRNASDGKKYLYDIVSIKKDTTISEWLTNRAASAAANAAGQKGSATDGKVSQTRPDVKHQSRNITAAQLEEMLNSSGLNLTRSDNNKTNRQIRAWIEERYPGLAERVEFFNDKRAGKVTVNRILGVTVVNFSYRLAPEFKYPAPMENACAVLHWMQINADEFFIDLDNVFTVGDSAGAQIELQLLCMLSNPEYTALFDFAPPKGFKVRAAAPNCGCYFIPLSHIVSPKRMGIIFDAFFPETYLPLLRQIKAYKYVNSAFPPAIVMSASHDYLSFKEYCHVFHVNYHLEAAAKCNDEQCDFFRRHMK